MNFLGIGPFELLLILVIATIVLGPERMAQAGRTLGRLYAQYSVRWRRDVDEMTRELRRELEMLQQEVEEIRQTAESEIKGAQAVVQEAVNVVDTEIRDTQAAFKGAQAAVESAVSAVDAEVQDSRAALKRTAEAQEEPRIGLVKQSAVPEPTVDPVPQSDRNAGSDALGELDTQDQVQDPVLPEVEEGEVDN